MKLHHFNYKIYFTKVINLYRFTKYGKLYLLIRFIVICKLCAKKKPLMTYHKWLIIW